MWVLLAETSDSGTAILMTVSGLIAGAVVWLSGWFSSRHERQRKESKEDEKTIVDHLQEVERRCNEENKELKTDLKYTNKRLQQVLAHLMYLEGILESKGIKFRRIDVDMADDAIEANHKQPSGTLPKSSPRIRDDSGEEK